MHARVLVLDHGQLVDLAELLEDWLEVLLLQIARDLADEELDGVWLLHLGTAATLSATLFLLLFYEARCFPKLPFQKACVGKKRNTKEYLIVPIIEVYMQRVICTF